MTNMTIQSAISPETTAAGRENQRKLLAHLPTVILWGTLALLFGTIVHVAMEFRFDFDEFEAVHTAWKIQEGDTIYVDFFQHHHPLLYYCLAPVIWLCGAKTATLLVIRSMMVLGVLGVLGITSLIARSLYGKGAALFAMLLLCTKYEFAFRALEVRPDNPQMLFGLLSVLLLLWYYDTRRMWILALSAGSLAVSFAFLQKAVFLCFLVGVVLLISTIKRETRLRDLLVFFAAFVLTAVVLLLPVFLASGLRTYYSLNWALNMRCLDHFSPWGTIWLTLTAQRSAFFWPMCAAGLLFFLKTPNQKRLAFLGIGLFASILCVRAPYAQYLIHSYPLLAVIGAAPIAYVYKRRRSGVVIGALLAAVLWYSSSLGGAPFVWWTNADSLAKIDHVLEITEESDYVLDGRPEFNVFRKDVSYFWYSIHGETSMLASYRTMKDFPLDFLDLIETYKPKVVSTTVLPEELLQKPQIQQHYSPDLRYPELLIRVDDGDM